MAERYAWVSNSLTRWAERREKGAARNRKTQPVEPVPRRVAELEFCSNPSAQKAERCRQPRPARVLPERAYGVGRIRYGTIGAAVVTPAPHHPTALLCCNVPTPVLGSISKNWS